MTDKEKLDLIIDALNEFGNKTCPRCEREIRWDDSISQFDIIKWLKEREE